jgi:single-strand DNA-binding protein
LHYSSWEKDGQKRSKLDVIADDIDLMQKSRHAAAQAPLQPPVAATPAQFTTVQTPPSADVFDEDIPF